jgi:LysR family glycine cleavage system transcriptional activator
MPDPLSSIPLGALRVFEAAARLQSFTRAAAELGMTQAAVSWQVRALEQRLGQPLFRRLPRQVALTPAGERLFRAANEAMTSLRAALADLQSDDEGVLAVSAIPTFAAQWLAPRLGAFQLKHPAIAVRLEASVRIADLMGGDMDVAVRSGSGDWPGLEAHRLFRPTMTPLCTPELAARLGGLSRPTDLLDAPRIGLPEEWTAWFSAAGVGDSGLSATPPRYAAETQTLEIASALRHHGVTLACPAFYSTEIAAGQLMRPFEAAYALCEDYWVVYARDRRRQRKIIAFRDWLLAAVLEDPAIEAMERGNYPPLFSVKDAIQARRAASQPQV